MASQSAMASQSNIASATHDVHIFFFPYLAHGHILSFVATARLFADRGVRCTIVTTPGNSSYILDAIEQANRSALVPLHLLLIPFPSAEVGLPPGVECTAALPSSIKDERWRKFFKALDLLRGPFRDLVVQHRPDCIVSDSLPFWPADVALELSIPSLVSAVTFSPFYKCVRENLLTSRADLIHPESDTIGPLVGLPHPIELSRSEVHLGPYWLQFFHSMQEAERKSLGVLFNSFDELAPEYVEHYRRRTKVWCVGPVQKLITNRSEDGGNWETIKSWLDSKEAESVVYISFGSVVVFPAPQLREIAFGLESCEHSFVWVVRGAKGKEIEEEFGPRVGNRGLILTAEWAPQDAILSHQAIGGFVTHCGQSSVMEAVCAGLPVIAWPAQREQFLNEKLVVEVLRIGVRILEGPRMRWVKAEGKQVVKRETVQAAVERLMGGGGGDAAAVGEMRRNAKMYAELARAATEEGGSSYQNLTSVIEEISMLSKKKKEMESF